MNEKEVIIKLFKLKIQENDIHMNVCSGQPLIGCYFDKNSIDNFIGISKNYPIIGFRDILIDLEDGEYRNLKIFFDNIMSESDRKKEEIKNKKIAKDLIVLSEIASLENINTSRRVLTEKYKNFKF